MNNVFNLPVIIPPLSKIKYKSTPKPAGKGQSRFGINIALSYKTTDIKTT